MATAMLLGVYVDRLFLQEAVAINMAEFLGAAAMAVVLVGIGANAPKTDEIRGEFETAA